MHLAGFLMALLAVPRNNRISPNTKKNGVRPKKNEGKSIIHDKRLKWAIDTDAVFLIDLENVRGKSNFDLTHRELLKRTTIWAKVNNLEDRVSMIVDHGSIHASYYLPEGGIALVFAGTRMKADDVLARDVSYFGRNAIVITADNDLMSRCRNSMERAEGDCRIQFINPIKFISDLDVLMNRVEREQQRLEKENEQEQIDDNTTSATATAASTGEGADVDVDANLSEELANKIDEEIKLRGSLYETETQMREKKNMNTPKKRRKLEKRARQLCERLAMKGGQNIDHLTTLNGISAYDRKFQDEVLSQWEQLRERATRREMTGDRILLAEHFRRQVEKVATAADVAATTTASTTEGANLAPAGDESDTLIRKNPFTYSEYINNLSGNNMATSMSSSGLSSSSNNSSDKMYSGKEGTVRLVVVSDTHGMEESLTPRGTLLPPGDILLHLGDFAIDAPLKKKKKAIVRFDQWLARQPHRTKIVLRGNHDPFKVDFPESSANFVSMPKSIAIDGKLTMTLVPYSSPRKLSSSWRKMPMYCDVLASHSPPNGILDKCYNGANAGCASLRGKVEKMIFGAPSLWLCGHIHEGRGKEEVAFGLSSRKTVVVNAANANTGRATSIEYGPIVLDVHQNQTLTLMQGDGIIDEAVTTTEDGSLLVTSS